MDCTVLWSLVWHAHSPRWHTSGPPCDPWGVPLRESSDMGRNVRCYNAEHERRRVQVVALRGVELR